MISVRGPRITGKLSLNIRAFSLSTPGDLFKGREEMIRCTSSQVTALKLKSSPVGMVKGEPSCSVITMLCSSASRAAYSETFLPTEAKELLNSFATVL